MTICKRVIYKGRVQGVGFRYTAQRLAAGFPVVGFVRNLPGGEVELVVEGAADQVDAFLAAVARQMAGYINGCILSDAASPGCSEFEIRF